MGYWLWCIIKLLAFCSYCAVLFLITADLQNATKHHIFFGNPSSRKKRKLTQVIDQIKEEIQFIKTRGEAAKHADAHESSYSSSLSEEISQRSLLPSVVDSLAYFFLNSPIPLFVVTAMDSGKSGISRTPTDWINEQN